MAKSIIQRDRENCYICGSTLNLQEHHCLHGNANRSLADKYGLVVTLCQEHHTGSRGVHHNRNMDLFLIQTAQSCFEEQIGNREEFMRIFGKNWL
jgi:hypothetical protein